LGISEEPDIQATVQPKRCELWGISEKMSKMLQHRIICHIHSNGIRSTGSHTARRGSARNGYLGKCRVIAPVALIWGRITGIDIRILFGDEKLAIYIDQVGMMRIALVDKMNFAA
jgi:hypothetical protein